MNNSRRFTDGYSRRPVATKSKFKYSVQIFDPKLCLSNTQFCQLMNLGENEKSQRPKVLKRIYFIYILGERRALNCDNSDCALTSQEIP